MSSKPKKTKSDIKNRLEKAGLSFSDEIPCKASFIMPDGSFLGLEANSRTILGYETNPSHTDFEFFLIRSGIKPCRRDNLLEDYGAIQLNDGTYEHHYECAYARMPSAVTEEQYGSLLRWLDHLAFGTIKRSVTISAPNMLTGYWFQSKKNPDGVLPEDIIKSIKRLGL